MKTLVLLLGVVAVVTAQDDPADDDDVPPTTTTATDSDAEEDALEAQQTAEEEGLMNEDDEAGAAMTDGGQTFFHTKNRCAAKPCSFGGGDCNKNTECTEGNVCRMSSCAKLNKNIPGARTFLPWEDCCGPSEPFDWNYCKLRGPCGDGEGDCDCNRQCGPLLMCGNNNCRRMHPGLGLHQKMDCCTRCSKIRVGVAGSRKKVMPEYFDAQKEVVGIDRTVVQPPPGFEDAAVWNLPPMTAEDSIKIQCCKRKKSVCEFWITVYHCKPCSSEINGGLPGALLEAGWDSGSCAPRFALPSSPAQSHAMTSFHRALHAGEKEIINLGKMAPHVVIYERVGPLLKPWCFKTQGPFPPAAPCVPYAGACLPP